jgi:hypothetical protein
MEQKREKLMINAVSAEPEAPRLKKTAQAIADAIEELGTFLSGRKSATLLTSLQNGRAHSIRSAH